MAVENQPEIEFDIDEDEGLSQPASWWSGVNDNVDVEIEGTAGEDESAGEEEGESSTDGGLTREELKAQLEASEARVLSLADAGNQAKAITDGIAQLGQAMQPQAAPTAPAISEEEFKKATDESFYDGPSDSLDAYFQRKIKPAVDQILISNAGLARELMTLKHPSEYGKYQAEIDTAISQLPQSQVLADARGSFEGAFKSVMANHQEDTINSKVEEKMEALKAELMAEMQGTTVASGNARNTAPRIPNHSEGGQTPSPARGSGARKIKITQADADEASRRGIPLKDYAAWKQRHRS